MGAFFCLFLLLHLGVFQKKSGLDLLALFVSVVEIIAVPLLILMEFHWGNKGQLRFNLLLFFLTPFLMVCVVEGLCNNHILNIFWNSPLELLLNYGWYLFVYAIVYVLTNRYAIALLTGNLFFFLLGTVNHFTLLHRGTPLLPWDIYAAKTAANVLDTYPLAMDSTLMLYGLLVVMLCAAACKARHVRQTRRRLLWGKTTAVALTGLFVFVFYNNLLMMQSFSHINNLWDQNRASRQHGLVLNLAVNAQYIAIPTPDGYSQESVSQLTALPQPSEKAVEEKPNIIAIMNESFADFETIGKLPVSEDPLSFVHSMRENTIRGQLLVSAFGAGTANSEFEFLTGNSMAFLPSGSIAYQQYVRKGADSLVSTLETQGYTSIALHPYLADGWNRPFVYDAFGFQDFLSLNDYKKPLIYRTLVSDVSSYEKLIKLYEEKKPEEKLFLFNVTMQNHGGYETKYDNFEETVQLHTTAQYPKAEQYLSLLKESDRAIADLVSYFSHQTEPTIILLFGDHFPNVEPEFYEELYGKPLDALTLEEMQKRYAVPFFLWANYDIEEPTIDLISANYLSTLLLKTAGLSLTSYHQFLDTLSQSVPAINVNGFFDASRQFHSFSEETQWEQNLNNYRILQYNNLFGGSERRSDFFSLTTPAQN